MVKEHGRSTDDTGDEATRRQRDDIARLRSELARRERDAKGLQRQNDRLKRENDGLQREKDRLQREKDRLQREIERLKQHSWRLRAGRVAAKPPPSLRTGGKGAAGVPAGDPAQPMAGGAAAAPRRRSTRPTGRRSRRPVRTAAARSK